MRTFHFLLLLAMLGGPLTGCTTVRNARKVQEGSSVQPGERTVTAAELGLLPGTTLDLARMEEIALRNVPTVQQARKALEQAEIALREAGGTQRPSVTASAGHSRSTHNADRHRQSTRNTGNWSGSLSMNWTVYDFGRTRAAVKGARAKVRAAEADLRYAEALARYAVRCAFIDLQRKQELLTVARDTEAQYKEHFEQVNTKYEVGRSTRYEKTKAEVDWDGSMLSTLTAANNVDNARGELNRSLGLAESPDYGLGVCNAVSYELNLDALMERAKANEPSLSALVSRVQAASDYVDQQVSALYPSLGVNLSATASGRNPGVPWLWQLSGGATLMQTLFDGGSNLRRVENAAIELQKARMLVAAKEQELYCSMRKAVLAAQCAEKQLEVAKLTEANARENLEIVNERFAQGKASSVERTDAQVRLTVAAAAVITAEHDRLDAQVEIARLLGE